MEVIKLQKDDTQNQQIDQSMHERRFLPEKSIYGSIEGIRILEVEIGCFLSSI